MKKGLVFLAGPFFLFLFIFFFGHKSKVFAPFTQTSAGSLTRWQIYTNIRR